MEDDGTPPAGNGRRMRTIEFDEADAPMLAAAMRLASGTALMYGARQERARARFQHYRRLFLAFSPPEADMFRDEEDWCEIAIAMEDSPGFGIVWEAGSWPDRDKGTAMVTVGRRAWHTRRCEITRGQAARLAAALDALAPAGCTRDTPDIGEETDDG